MQNKWNESSSKQALGHGKTRFKAKPTEIYLYSNGVGYRHSLAIGGLFKFP